MFETGQHDQTKIRHQCNNNADLTQPQAASIENHLSESLCATVDLCPIPLSDSVTGPAIVGFGANIETAVHVSSASTLPNCRVEAVVNHECQLAVVRQQLRSLVLLMRYRCDRISHLLRRSQIDSYSDQLRIIQHALQDSIREMRCIYHQWHGAQLQFQHIRTLLLHTCTSGDQVFELQQSSALHACHSLLHLQPRLEHINSLLFEILSQLQQANTYAAAQVLHVSPQPQAQANPQQVAMLLALLPGPGNVMPFQIQIEEDHPSLTQILTCQ